MREIDVSEITNSIKDMCIGINHELSEDMKSLIDDAAENEISELGCKVLNTLKENLKVARDEMIPICQDTGMAVVYMAIGQDVHFVGGDLNAAINEGIKRGYDEGFLRKSVVEDPIERTNTRDNTPAVIHYSVIPGENINITVTAKGFGSENMSRVFMKKPADGIEGVRDAILTAVKDAGPNACPPMVVGVGVGGTFEKAAELSKEALAGIVSPYNRSWTGELEQEMLQRINSLEIGPAGLGGKYTALKVSVNAYPTHIAGLPVAVNICCHVNRHASVTL